MKDHLNQWLNSDLVEWKKIRNRLQQSLSPDDEIRVILQTDDIQLRQLPWQAWELFNTDYPQTEIALSATEYQSSSRMPAAGKKVRILAVLGNSDKINIMGIERKGSLSDAALAKVLDKLEPYQPRVIGLDIFHNFSFSNQSGLANRLRDMGSFIGVCKHNLGDEGVKPPPKVPQDQDRLGFADLAIDRDGVVRRHLIALADYRNSPCPTEISLSLRLALRYLMLEGLDIQLHRIPNGNFKLVNTELKLLKGNAVGYQELGGEQMLLNYRAREPEKIAASVTLRKILTGDFNPKLLEDRIVLMGVTDSSVRDMHYTPYSLIGQPNQEMPGVFVQAQMVSQLISAVLDHRSLLGVLPIWGCSLVGGVIAWRIRTSLVLGVAMVTAIVALSGIGFVLLVVKSTLVPLVPSVLALVATAVLVYKKSQFQQLN